MPGTRETRGKLGQGCLSDSDDLVQSSVEGLTLQLRTPLPLPILTPLFFTKTAPAETLYKE
jgi:hypothetical protein